MYKDQGKEGQKKLFLKFYLIYYLANAENQQIAVKLKTYTDFQDN